MHRQNVQSQPKYQYSTIFIFLTQNCQSSKFIFSGKTKYLLFASINLETENKEHAYLS